MIISLFIYETPQNHWMLCCVRVHPCHSEQPRGTPAREKRNQYQHHISFRLKAEATNVSKRTGLSLIGSRTTDPGSRSNSVCKPPHPDIQDETKGGQRRNH